MNSSFRDMVESLHPKLVLLMAQVPASNGSVAPDMPQRGVYLFTENGTHLYVGRSNRMHSRYVQHCRVSSLPNMAGFAFRLAREATGVPAGNYGPGNEGSAGVLMRNESFVAAFREAKDRVRRMEFRYVEERDPTRHALLEIYCAVALDAKHNSFENH